jgi:hypothetical protein
MLHGRNIRYGSGLIRPNSSRIGYHRGRRLDPIGFGAFFAVGGELMNDLRRWLKKRVGRRNLPFLIAVLVLAMLIVVVMAISPSTESGVDPRSPTVVTAE